MDFCLVVSRPLYSSKVRLPPLICKIDLKTNINVAATIAMFDLKLSFMLVREIKKLLVSVYSKIHHTRSNMTNEHIGLLDYFKTTK